MQASKIAPSAVAPGSSPGWHSADPGRTGRAGRILAQAGANRRGPARAGRILAQAGVDRRGPTASAAGVRPQQPQRRQRLIMVKGVQRGGQRVETGAKLLSKQALHPAELCIDLEVAHVQLGLQRIQQPGLGALAPGQLRMR